MRGRERSMCATLKQDARVPRSRLIDEVGGVYQKDAGIKYSHWPSIVTFLVHHILSTRSGRKANKRIRAIPMTSNTTSRPPLRQEGSNASWRVRICLASCIITRGHGGRQKQLVGRERARLTLWPCLVSDEAEDLAFSSREQVARTRGEEGKKVPTGSHKVNRRELPAGPCLRSRFDPTAAGIAQNERSVARPVGGQPRTEFVHQRGQKSRSRPLNGYRL